ncbi:ECs_2282 family putative zinc-binding protein [Desulfatiglans anilini]|uniref:ECs_2282 family putative zinc-binding protein n=1 Tax=Desulfatiglans anilini TaxID=90728 RepID=UPI00048180CC|nr:hypothetical protein [Desulfatiglans anilini]
MRPEGYDRKVSLHCPTCGGDQFEFDDAIQSEDAYVRCIGCGREMTKGELIRENTENIQEHLNDISKDVKDDLAKEMKSMLRNAFKGNKHIKFE